MFYVQAEDGIRDLVRSRGLGDVYKRQDIGDVGVPVRLLVAAVMHRGAAGKSGRGGPQRIIGRRYQDLVAIVAVSYTHLPLPTGDLG